MSIWERLDRAVASHEWFIEFPGTRVHHLNSTTSDHKLLWVDFSNLEFQQEKKLFRFEEMWLVDKGCGEGVWQSSYDGAENTKVVQKLENCEKELTRWNKNYFSNIRRKLEKKRKEKRTNTG